MEGINTKKYVIIPGCSDLNRGDQALVWETKRLAEDAGFKGDYYLVKSNYKSYDVFFKNSSLLKKGIKVGLSLI